MAALVHGRTSRFSGHAYNGVRVRQILEVSASTSRSANAPSRSGERRDAPDRLLDQWQRMRRAASRPIACNARWNIGSRLKCGRGLSDWTACSRLPPRACAEATRCSWVKCRPSADSADDPSVPAAARRCSSEQRRLRIAAAHRIDEILERGLGGVADDRLDVVVADDALAALRIERELDDLRARQRLVGAEPRHQIVARLAVDAEPGLGKLGVDQRASVRSSL